MSLQNSYLSQAGYGYDTVVAVTQSALNETIKTYYLNANASTSKDPFTAVTYYFATDPDSGLPTIIDIDSLKLRTNGIDPMTVPAWSGSGAMPANINSIINGKFNFAFTFRIGNPPGAFSAYNYIALNPSRQSAVYYLLCKNLQIVFWNPDNKTWINVTQTTANQFNIHATINLQNVIDNTNLPPAVQAAVDALDSTTVNVQQLMLDLDSAVVNPGSSFPGLDSSCSVFPELMRWFTLSYFGVYRDHNAPALNYSLMQPNSTTLMPTAMNFYTEAFVDSKGNLITNPTVDEQDLATLNYLFSDNNDTLPAGKQLNWNWLENNAPNANPALPTIDPNAEVNLYSGAVAVSRNAFGKYMASQLKTYVLSNYWIPTVIANKDGFEFDVSFEDAGLGAHDGVQPFDNISVLMGDPDTLLQYISENSSSAKGLWADGDHMNVTAHFQLTVSVDTPSGNQQLRQTLTLTQTLWLFVDASQSGNIIPSFSGTPFKKTFTDVFVVKIDDQGNMAFDNVSSAVDDESEDTAAVPSYVTEALNIAINWAAAISFKEIPVAMPKQFVFPGGNAFTFKDVQFSQYSDLVSHIGYDSEQ